MSLFADKIKNYKDNKFQEFQDHYGTLAGGQKPHTFLITCADSRLCPQEVSQTQAGEIFVIRNAGNLVPAYDNENPSNEGLTLEYGISVLGIPELIVCGHASCGAMGGLKDIDHVKTLPLVHKALKTYRDAHTSDVESKDLDQLIEWNVDNQLKNLFSYPFVQEGLKNGTLKVYGMVYDFVNAEVSYSAEMNASGEVQ